MKRIVWSFQSCSHICCFHSRWQGNPHPVSVTICVYIVTECEPQKVNLARLCCEPRGMAYAAIIFHVTDTYSQKWMARREMTEKLIRGETITLAAINIWDFCTKYNDNRGFFLAFWSFCFVSNVLSIHQKVLTAALRACSAFHKAREKNKLDKH